MSIEERNVYLTKRRWIVLAACCVANLCIGAIYAWSVFAGPMAEHLNSLHGTALTAADLAIVFSIANGDAFITTISGGYFDNKIGSRKVILTGTVVFGLGFIVSGLASNVFLLIVGFSLMCGLGNGFAYVCTISTAVKFFPDKKGLAGGISTAVFGISSVIIPPIADALNNSVGVCLAFIIFGAVIVVLAVLCSLLIINCPDDFVPTGWTPPAESLRLSSAEDKTAKQMLSTPVFYVMLGMLTIGSTLGLMTISEASAAAQSMVGMTASAAALVVSALALFNTGGRIIAGWISDRIGRINTLAGVFVLAVAALWLLYASGGDGSAAMFCTGICLVGLCYGAFMGVYPGFTSDQFGMKYSSLNYGIMFIGFSAGGIIGPLLMQGMFNSRGTYRPAFLVAAAFAAAGFALTFVYRALARRTSR